MTREKEIRNKAIEVSYLAPFGHSGRDMLVAYDAFILGAQWADKHPNSKHVYTKKQLLDMGFAFTTNGDIVTPEQFNEDLKKYLQHQKQKFIKKAREWLSDNKDNYIIDIEGETLVDDQILIDFCKIMEE